MHTSPLPALLSTYTPYPFPLLRGEGDRVFDDLGTAYWDFYGGHCVCATGHAHPRVVQAIARQASELLFYSTAAQLPVRDRAAEALLAFANGGLAKPLASIFFCNSGTEANENALKLAVKLTGRTRFTSFRGGWHGRSTLALSVTDDPGLRLGFEPLLAPTEFLPFGDEAALEGVDLSRSAAVILEPIQSMAGIRSTSPSFLRRLRQACDAGGAMLIFDEVQTGMGRLGTPFAASFFGTTPDLITSAKGLASGVPMGAVLMSEAIASALKPGDLGSTFGGGPLASAALLATLGVIHSEGLMPRASAMASRLRRELARSPVSKVEGEGLLLGLRVPSGAAGLRQHLLTHRILVGGSGDPEVLRLMPPLNLSDAALDALVSAVWNYTV
jgi:acetylornithine/succinyldiaminopimelate/putrescine aminotransferase